MIILSIPFPANQLSSITDHTCIIQMLTVGGLRTGIQQLLNFLTHKFTQLILQAFSPFFSVHCTAYMDYFVIYLANKTKRFIKKCLQVRENHSSHIPFSKVCFWVGRTCSLKQIKFQLCYISFFFYGDGHNKCSLNSGHRVTVLWNSLFQPR